ncbi:hypothetical protein Xmau_00150 [Xenorhabdus mauleonii]|uniref:Uncharacterized protein n=1 Tax=Xenorhabdus mauleonii TaxID=351675 RepID=A0A1I3N7P7_9GAMM|nr:hypothetical protein [Xenorhabdus mauleonii]PHM45762.1 hypothetical protein Xmau_00150 [Xenorhabdus mauleonii]SFJ05070.1 hypothetical protein SAMN05421680_105110 [Xenorhabdus mauleonii]
MSYKFIINKVGVGISVYLTAASGTEAGTDIGEGNSKKIYYGSREDDRLVMLMVRFSRNIGEVIEINYTTSTIGVGIDAVFNNNTHLLLSNDMIKDPYTIRVSGYN